MKAERSFFLSPARLGARPVKASPRKDGVAGRLRPERCYLACGIGRRRGAARAARRSDSTSPPRLLRCDARKERHAFARA